jgi:hypothetical protein
MQLVRLRAQRAHLHAQELHLRERDTESGADREPAEALVERRNDDSA